ncbi:MAG: O-antigen ligase family protein [Chitinophagales bacterium]
MSYLSPKIRFYNPLNKVKDWFSKQVFIQKLNNPIGYVALGMAALAIAVVIPMLGLKIGILLLGAIFAVPVLLFCLFRHQIGLIIMISVAFVVIPIKKVMDVPVGVLMDGLMFLMFFGMIIKQVIERDWSFAKNPISAWILVWVFLNLIQVINPSAESKMAWLYTVRSMAGLILLYFIACYAFSSLAYIKLVFKLIIGIALCNTLYGFYQEFVGFPQFELAWLYSDPERFQLIYQWGHLRLFSTFADPTTFGIYTVYMGMFCGIMVLAPITQNKRIVLGVCAVLMLWVTAYTGTRTAYVLIPAGLFFFTFMTMRKEVLIVAFIGIILGAGLMMKSTGNPIIYRIQSAFKPQEDASMQLRLKNQAFIQPFIHKHPMGAGLGSTGLWGQRFTPDSFLAHFAHDSGFVRVAIELGWIGLLLYCIFLFVVMYQAVYYYYRVKDPTIKTMYLGLSNVLFLLILANYPQEAIVQLPTSIVFYIVLAAVVRLKDFDIEPAKEPYIIINKPKAEDTVDEIEKNQDQPDKNHHTDKIEFEIIEPD